jgi:hypothetical protein
MKDDVKQIEAVHDAIKRAADAAHDGWRPAEPTEGQREASAALLDFIKRQEKQRKK